MDIRQLHANSDCWYVVARSTELVGDRPLGVTFWQRDIVLYRDASGTIRALEDCCPHRHVKLSQGVVRGDRLECAYHGWQFDEGGYCTHIPYLQERQKLPTCRLRTYPVREQDGFIWLFPGSAARANETPLLGLPEWDDPNFITSVATFSCQAHYSYLVENLMDMYHGHLHTDLQAWTDASLVEICEDDDRVDALYRARSYYRVDKIWSVLQLFVPALRQLHPESLQVSYAYPHWQARLGRDFRLYCLLCPVGPLETRAYLVHLTSLQSFWRLQKLPMWFRNGVKNALSDVACGLLERLIQQDVIMIEQEQQAHLQDPKRRSYELNQTLASVRRLICSQAAAATMRSTHPPRTRVIENHPVDRPQSTAALSKEQANSRSK